MRRATPSFRLGLRSWDTWVLAALVFAAPAASAAGAAARVEDQPLVTFREASAEISVPAPTRHAVVLQEPGKFRRLYARGDIVFDPQDPTRSLTIQRVDARALVFREGPRGRQQSVPTGRPIPGFAGLRLIGTVMLNEVQYQYRAVERITHGEPVLVSLDGTRATLEVEVVRSPALPTGLSANVVAPPVTALDNLTLLVRARISAQSKDAVMATSPLRAELAHILSLGLIEVLPRDALDTRRLDGTRSSCIFGEE